MYCKTCNGRVFIDRVYSQKMRVELYCLLCGRRWMIRKDGNIFGLWLTENEKNLQKKSCIST